MGDNERSAGDECPPVFKELRRAIVTFATKLEVEVRMVRVPHTLATWDLFFWKTGLTYHQAQGIAAEVRHITTRLGVGGLVLRVYTTHNPAVWSRGTAYPSAVRLCPSCGADTLLCVTCYERETGGSRRYPGSFCPACGHDRCVEVDGSTVPAAMGEA